jgi:hypothetical protein
MFVRYFGVGLLFFPLLVLSPQSPSTKQSQHPLMDKVAQKVIDKYQNSTCEELKAKKQEPATAQQEEMTKKVVMLLRSDPNMRQQFLNKVAGPIANKMFECGMIP